VSASIVLVCLAAVFSQEVELLVLLLGYLFTFLMVVLRVARRERSIEQRKVC
jgi:hypothetical protein